MRNQKSSCKHHAGCGHRLCTLPPKNATRARLSRDAAKADAARGPRPKEVAAGVVDFVGHGKVMILRRAK